MKLVKHWYKAWSVWLLAACEVIVQASAFMPDLQQALPADWYVWAFRIILIARIIQQNGKGA